MRYERFLSPVSEAEPCGPDLDELDDPSFRNYVSAAEGGIPASFFAKRDDEEAKPVNLESEIQAIDGLLARSRHLRLLILEARLQAFYGSLEGFADVVSATAELLGRFWNDVHPRGEAGDFTRRANLVRSLEDIRQIVIPLQHRILLRDRRLGPFSMRRELIASGAVQPRPDEEKGDPDAIRRRLGDPENLEALQENHRAVEATIDALGRLRKLFVEHAGYEQAPSFDMLLGFLNKTKSFFEEVRPDLAGPLAGAEAPDDEPDAAAKGEDERSNVPLPAVVAPKEVGSVAIGSRASANAALLAAEEYFLRHEPTAAALILVHKSRELMDRPLVEAVAALMSNAADDMAITFKGYPALKIDMAQMRVISESVFPQAASSEEAPETEVATAVAPAGTRTEVASLLAGVEAVLRGTDPASAVPILLKRAREWLGKDFAAIVGEMLPQPDR